MEELGSIFAGIGNLLAVIGGGLSALAVCYAGILWITDSGDPGKMAQARTALMGVVGGLVVVGISFLVPRTISYVVVEPVGGSSLISASTGVDCDRLLRQQLVFQRGASTERHVNEVISQIHVTWPDCPSGSWNPRANDVSYHEVDPVPALGHNPAIPRVPGCFTIAETQPSSDAAPNPVVVAARVGGEDIPPSLRVGGSSNGNIRPHSGRDSENNIIVYWDPGLEMRPTDGAVCWLYVSRLRSWSGNY